MQIPQNRYATEEENNKKVMLLVKEIQRFYELQYENNIVQFYGFCIDQGQGLICMELMEMSLKV